MRTVKTKTNPAARRAARLDRIERQMRRDALAAPDALDVAEAIEAEFDLDAATWDALDLAVRSDAPLDLLGGDFPEDFDSGIAGSDLVQVMGG